MQFGKSVNKKSLHIGFSNNLKITNIWRIFRLSFILNTFECSQELKQARFVRSPLHITTNISSAF
jgi:hypothetical protein